MNVLSYIRQVLIKKITGYRLISVCILISYLIYIYTKPLRMLSTDLSCKITPWFFPFIQSNLYYAYIFLLSIIYIFSDTPFLHYENMYEMIRTGRRKWAIGQVGGIIMISIGIMIYSWIISCVCIFDKAEWSAGWGAALNTISMTDAANNYEFLFSILYETIKCYSPYILLLITLVVGSLVISTIGLGMFLCGLVWGREAAVVLSSGLIFLLFLADNFPYLRGVMTSRYIPVSWIRVTEIGIKIHGSQYMPPLPYVIGVLSGINIVLAFGVVYRCERSNLYFDREE